MSEYGPVASYLPHRPPMLLIDDIVEVGTDTATLRTTIHPDCVFAIDGRVHPSAMIEFCAQACAIAVGVTASREGKPPRLGVILGCREVSFTIDSFAVGDALELTVERVFGQSQLAAFACEVHRAGECCVKIHMSVADASALGELEA